MYALPRMQCLFSPLQALLLSHLEASPSALLDSAHDTQRAINCLLPFLTWFRKHFQIAPPPASSDGRVDDFPYDAPTIHGQVCVPAGSLKEDM